VHGQFDDNGKTNLSFHFFILSSTVYINVIADLVLAILLDVCKVFVLVLILLVLDLALGDMVLVTFLETKYSNRQSSKCNRCSYVMSVTHVFIGLVIHKCSLEFWQLFVAPILM